jgi:hypothetical protein
MTIHAVYMGEMDGVYQNRKGHLSGMPVRSSTKDNDLP